MRIDRVLFDLDGTLSDPSEGITRCIAFALGRMNIACPPLKELEIYIGPPLIGTFAELGIAHSRLDEAVALFRERFTEVGITENHLYDGVPELLATLQNADVEIMLATSKPEVFAERILEQFELTGYFSEIAGALLDGSRLHKADVIAHALRNSQSGHGVMVGDRKHDLIGAAEHGIEAIGVTWGFGSFEELAAEKPLAIVDTLDELAALLLK